MTRRFFSKGAPLFAIAASLYALLCLVVAFKIDLWPGELVISVAPQLGLVGGVAVLLCLFLKRAKSALVFAGFSALAFAGAHPFMASPRAAVASPDTKIIWANVYGRLNALEQTFTLARRENADMVVITETPFNYTLEPDLFEKGLGAEQFPHRRGDAYGDKVSVTVFSQHPINRFEPIIYKGKNSASFTLLLKGREFGFAFSHPTIPTSPAKMARRNHNLLATAQTIADRKLDFLIGDLNTVSWSPAFKKLEARSGLERVSANAPSTWITRLAFFGLPLDHVLARPPHETSVQVGASIGSDHFPLIVTIKLADEQ